MFRRKFLDKLIVLGISIFILVSTTPTYAMTTYPGKMVSKESRWEEKDYVVMVKTEEQANNLEKEYDSAEVISSNSQNCLQENHMTSLTLILQKIMKNIMLKSEKMV